MAAEKTARNKTRTVNGGCLPGEGNQSEPRMSGGDQPMRLHSTARRVITSARGGEVYRTGVMRYESAQIEPRGGPYADGGIVGVLPIYS